MRPMLPAPMIPILIWFSSLFAYVEALAGFQEGFHAGKDTRPASRNFARHLRTGLEVPMRHSQAHHVANRLDLECDARLIGEIVRVGPAQDEAFEWRAFQNFARDPDLSFPDLSADMLPLRALLPVRDVLDASPVLAGEFGFCDCLPQFLRSGANVCRVNLLWLLHFKFPCSYFLRDPSSDRSTPE